MKYSIEYHKRVISDDFSRLSGVMQKRVIAAVDTKLKENPEVYGKPLHESLKNHRALRVGDYRIVYRVIKKKVRIFIIEHRSKVYTEALKRLK